MWFKILFYPDLPHVSAAIAEDGDVYFKAADVGKFLGYSNNYRFAAKHASTDLNSKLPEKLRAGKKIVVMNFGELSDKLAYARDKRKTSISVDEFPRLWFDGRVVDGIVPNFPILAFKFAPLLRVEGDAKYRMQDWIEVYRTTVLRFYHHVRTLESKTDPPSTDLNPPSVESDYYYEPPRENETKIIDETDMVIDETVNNPESEVAGNDSEVTEKNSGETRLPNAELEMHFDAFPPRRIRIRIRDAGFDYMLTD